MKHTPEPWTCDGFDPASESVRDANAARICACVNACAGMADPARELAELRAQRDMLREALGECITEDGALTWRNAKFAGMRLEHISNTARAALARCEKGQS